MTASPKGRIKAGEGSFIGNAGEYYVVAEMLKRGVIAALTPRNTPAFDVIATRHGRTIKIRVKTKSAQYPEWQWVVKKDGAIFRALSDDGDFTVLVDLPVETKDIRFFVVPTPVVDRWLKADFQAWLETPGKYGRPHSPSNKKRQLNQHGHAQDLSVYLNNWESLWE